nr:hypothetical protein [Escherichia coli O25b:H4-ST131]
MRNFSVLIATGDETSFYIHLDVLKVGLKNSKVLCQLLKSTLKVNRYYGWKPLRENIRWHKTEPPEPGRLLMDSHLQ